MFAMNGLSGDLPSPVLQVRGLRKRHGTKTALDGVDLDLRAGEWIVLLGPNGAGKTTLFSLLAGLYASDAGEIRVHGRDLKKNLSQAHASMGLVFQQNTLDMETSVLRNLRFHADLHGMDRRHRERRMQQLTEKMQLSEIVHDPVRTLSGGNRRRVELVRALLHEPAILIMDEPTVGLDPASRVDLLEQVRKLRDEKIAILWATHLVDEADCADRIVVIHQGRIRTDGSPQRLRAMTPHDSINSSFLELTQCIGASRMEPRP